MGVTLSGEEQVVGNASQYMIPHTLRMKYHYGGRPLKYRKIVLQYL
jgi:hypothetical protein